MAAFWVGLPMLASGFADEEQTPHHTEPPSEQTFLSVDQLDHDNLLGIWKQVHVESEGRDMTAAEKPTRNHWIITPDKITINVRGQSSGSWTYRCQPHLQPPAIDLTPVNKKDVTYPCVYKLEGNKLTVCLQNFPKRGRPQDFQSRPNSGIGKFIYVRTDSIAKK